MRKFFTVVAKLLAIISAFFFVAAALFALILFNTGRQLFNPKFYENALSDLDIYETFPSVIGSILTSGFSADPCLDNPIACENISNELRTCYQSAFGEDRYISLASGQQLPTDAERSQIQSCLNQFGENPGSETEDYNIQTAPNDVQDCIKSAVGEPAYSELYRQERPPTSTEQQKLQTCFSNVGDSSFAGGMPEYFKNLSAQDWEKIIKIRPPPEQMKVMVESVLDDVFAYIGGDSDNVTVSLIRVKDRLKGPAGEDLIRQIITSQPSCTAEELISLTGITGSENLVLCNPPGDILEIIIPLLQQELTNGVTQLPDEVVIIKPVPVEASSGDVGPLGNDPITALRRLRFILSLTPLLPLIFLSMITVFGVRSLKGWMRWWGIPFFFTGATAIVLGFNMSTAMVRVWTLYIEPRLPAFLPTEGTNLIRDLASYLAHDLTEHIVVQALILLVIGLVAWIGSYFLNMRAQKEAPTP